MSYKGFGSGIKYIYVNLSKNEINILIYLNSKMIIMQEIKNILSKKVSFQAAAWSPISKEMYIDDIFQEIRNAKYSSKIQNLRNYLASDNIEAYNIHKKALPAVTFCGIFDVNRRRENLKEYNHLIVIDIDKLEDKELLRVKNILSIDEYVLSYWESPSKKGIKGLVSIKYESFEVNTIDKLHKSAFIKLSAYFAEKYKIILDESGSDTTRLCFVSCDPDLVVKERYLNFEILGTDTDIDDSVKKEIKTKSIILKGDRNKLFNSSNRNNPSDRKLIQAIIKYLSKRGMSITSSYEEWYKVAYAISNTFTFEIGEKYFLSLCKLDGDSYNEANSRSMLNYCYINSMGNIKFNTILYYANLKGYYTNLQGREVSKAD